MTLVIAGYSVANNEFGFASNDNANRSIDGIAISSDTSITDNGRILVSGFKKVVDIPIKVMGVNLLGDYFNGYLGSLYEGGCFVAFAGSTLVTQHMINSIKNHLTEIYPTYLNDGHSLAMTCENHKFLRSVGRYDNDMFSHADILPLLTHEYLSNVVSHSIESVIASSERHDGMRANFRAFSAEFIFGVQCPSSKGYYIYRYTILSNGHGGAVVKKELISKDKVAVIGMREDYEEEANECYKQALEQKKDIARTLHDFVVTSVREKNSIGIFGVGMPCSLYEYDRGVVRKTELTNE